MKMFNKILMESEFSANLLKDGYFVDGDGNDAEVYDGAIVSIKGLRDHDLYTGMKDLNAREITAYDEDYPIYGIVDYVGVSHGDVLGVNYRVGDKIPGTYPVAGEGTRVRIPAVGDEFYVAGDNFDDEDFDPDVGKFGIPDDGSTLFVVTDSAPEAGFCVEIEDTKPLIMGQVNEGTILYRCRVLSI